MYFEINAALNHVLCSIQCVITFFFIVEIMEETTFVLVISAQHLNE